jgi:hypothetical protein
VLLSLPVYVQFTFLSSGNRSWIWMVCRKVKSCWQGKTTLPVANSRKMVRLLSWTTSEKGISRAYELCITNQPLVDWTLISLQCGISVFKSPCSSFIPTTWRQSALSHIFFQPPPPWLRDDLEFVETEQVITCFCYITCFFFVVLSINDGLLFNCAERQRAKRDESNKNQDGPGAVDELQNPSLSRSS